MLVNGCQRASFNPNDSRLHGLLKPNDHVLPSELLLEGEAANTRIQGSVLSALPPCRGQTFDSRFIAFAFFSVITSLYHDQFCAVLPSLAV